MLGEFVCFVATCFWFSCIFGWLFPPWICSVQWMISQGGLETEVNWPWNPFSFICPWCFALFIYVYLCFLYTHPDMYCLRFQRRVVQKAPNLFNVSFFYVERLNLHIVTCEGLIFLGLNIVILKLLLTVDTMKPGGGGGGGRWHVLELDCVALALLPNKYRLEDSI